jgi:hypothetical protein
MPAAGGKQAFVARAASPGFVLPVVICAAHAYLTAAVRAGCCFRCEHRKTSGRRVSRVAFQASGAGFTGFSPDGKGMQGGQMVRESSNSV